MATIESLKIDLERDVRLNKVKCLYLTKDFEELIVILKESLSSTTSPIETIVNSTNLSISTQFEVLLEAFWTLEHYEDCMIWSERCLKYSVDNFLRAPSDTWRQSEWGNSVTFALTYIEALILEESISIGRKTFFFFIFSILSCRFKLYFYSKVQNNHSKYCNFSFF